MSSRTVERSGSPTPRTAKNEDGGTAKDTSIVYREKVNSAPGGDLLTRTIACRPPNEDRIRGIVV
ncbi:MAG: hypothetical protein PHF53_10510 [Bacteroidales bacterium]|jgi:hypothetical protein|nr:hypothetical protein [Bacteroidales bacterium]